MFDWFLKYGYFGIFAALICAGFGLPIPEELPVLTAGGLCAHADTLKPGQEALDPNRLRWFIMLPVCIIGVVLGDGVLYTIGRIWGPTLLANAWVQRKLVPPEKRASIEKNFHDRGVLILLTARVTPGIRSPIFIMAGVLRVPVARFLLADGLYAVPGVTTLFFLAYFLTDQVMEVFHKIDQYKPLLIAIVLSVVAGGFLYRFITSRRVTTGAPSEVPLINKPIEMVTEAATHAVEKTVNVATHAVEKTIEAVTHHHRATPSEKPAETLSDSKPQGS
jgi:membrane protein DedA with SNARE-associated domain